MKTEKLWPHTDDNRPGKHTLVPREDRLDSDHNGTVWIVPHAGDEVRGDVHDMVFEKLGNLNSELLMYRAAAAWYRSLGKENVRVRAGKEFVHEGRVIVPKEGVVVHKGCTIDRDQIDPSMAHSYVQAHLDSANRIERVCLMLRNHYGHVLEIYRVSSPDIYSETLRADRSPDTVSMALSGRGRWGE